MDAKDVFDKANESQAKQFEAQEKIAEVKIKLAKKISDRLDQDDELSVEEMKELSNLLREISK